ncbi:MAG: cupin 2 protein [Actinomycetota bacterium]|nr:cupin 2 protein [Actinomycetota bacterium]
MAPVPRGRLRPPSDAPENGETTHHLVSADDGRTRVEQILSGRVDTPVDYLEPRPEWVTVLAGGATVEIAGERIDLGPGDWVLLPADVPHRLTRVDDGTSWLALHLDPS